MRKLGIGVLSLVGVPGVVFAIAYGMGCSNDGENPALLGIGVKGTRCPDDGNPCTIEDCSKGFLDVRELDDDTPVGAGTNECRRLVCQKVNDVMQPVDAPLVANTTCSIGICDGNGNCVDSCGDNVQNGAEDGIDCGGPNCMGCNGAQCGTDASLCVSNKCIDGVCCVGNCSVDCWSCNVEGHEGTCAPVPANSTDGTCVGTAACNANGECKRAVLADCLSNDHCASGACIGKCGATHCQIGGECVAEPNGKCQTDLKCRYGAGVACEDFNQCASGICTAEKYCL